MFTNIQTDKSSFENLDILYCCSYQIHWQIACLISILKHLSKNASTLGKSQVALHNEKLNLIDLLWFFWGWGGRLLPMNGFLVMQLIFVLRETFTIPYLQRLTKWKQSETNNKEKNLHYRNRELATI